jgi:hypothetical protein
MEARVLALLEAMVVLVPALLAMGLVLVLMLTGAGDGVGEGDALRPDIVYKKKRTTRRRLRGGN